MTRSTGDLRCGILKLRQRLEATFPADENSLIIDEELKNLYLERHPDWIINKSSNSDTLYINSRIKLDTVAIDAIKSLSANQFLLQSEVIFALRSSNAISSYEDIMQFTKAHPEGFVNNTTLALYHNLSDLIHDNSRLLRYDFEEFFYDEENYMETEQGVTLLNPYNIWIGEGTIMKPGVILDASEGPIVIDTDVLVLPNAVICGPAYIGKKSTIKIGAKIYPGTSIGPVCKIGGEVEGSIFQAFSNKQHEGFIGHSYIGEWVNIGADTNNSDLKNTYKGVSYYSYPEQRKVDSGTMFLGTLIGDHAKLGINCTINTGCVIGVGSNLWGSALITDYIPAFSWGMADSLTPYRMVSFLETARLVKGRRKLSLGDAEEVLYTHLQSLFS